MSLTTEDFEATLEQVKLFLKNAGLKDSARLLGKEVRTESTLPCRKPFPPRSRFSKLYLPYTRSVSAQAAFKFGLSESLEDGSTSEEEGLEDDDREHSTSLEDLAGITLLVEGDSSSLPTSPASKPAVLAIDSDDEAASELEQRNGGEQGPHASAPKSHPRAHSKPHPPSSSKSLPAPGTPQSIREGFLAELLADEDDDSLFSSLPQKHAIPHSSSKASPHRPFDQKLSLELEMGEQTAASSGSDHDRLRQGTEEGGDEPSPFFDHPDFDAEPRIPPPFPFGGPSLGGAGGNGFNDSFGGTHKASGGDLAFSTVRSFCKDQCAKAFFCTSSKVEHFLLKIGEKIISFKTFWNAHGRARWRGLGGPSAGPAAPSRLTRSGTGTGRKISVRIWFVAKILTT